MLPGKRRSFAFAFGVVVALLSACAGTTRPPATASGIADAGDGGDDEGEGEGEARRDADGDAEATDEAVAQAAEAGPCPASMVLVAAESGRFCIDKYEASLVEIAADGSEKPYPHWLPVDGHTVRAVSVPDVFPQGYISEIQAEDACSASNKRLCSHTEWKTACMGPSKTAFPYGESRKANTCHDAGKSAVGAVFGARAMTDPVASRPPTRPAPATAPGKAPASQPAARGVRPRTDPRTATARRDPHVTKGRAAETSRPRASRTPPATAAKKADPKRPGRTPSAARAAPPPAKRIVGKPSTRPASVEPSVWSQLNDPRLGQVDGALAKTGSHAECTSAYGAVDMVGNLHEWVRTDPALPHGTFAGGYYLDTSINGDGCNYRTSAHAHEYHDYSTGFRCCAEAKPDP